MHLRGPSATLLVIASIVLAGLLAGCAGGGDQAKNSGSQTADGEQQGEATQADAPVPKIALGTVISVKPDRRKIILRPSTEQQGDRLIFKVVDGARITLDDQQAEMADVQEGQQAQIQYTSFNEQNRARVVGLISSGEETSG